MKCLNEYLDHQKVDDFINKFMNKVQSLDESKVDNYVHKLLDIMDYQRDRIEVEMLLGKDMDLLLNNHAVISIVYNTIVISGLEVA
jgi:hypothetical protein